MVDRPNAVLVPSVITVPAPREQAQILASLLRAWVWLFLKPSALPVSAAARAEAVRPLPSFALENLHGLYDFAGWALVSSTPSIISTSCPCSWPVFYLRLDSRIFLSRPELIVSTSSINIICSKKPTVLKHLLGATGLTTFPE